jgi:hypothetical protein
MLLLSRALLPQRFAPVGNGRFLKSPRFTRAFFYAGDGIQFSGSV